MKESILLAITLFAVMAAAKSQIMVLSKGEIRDNRFWKSSPVIKKEKRKT